MSKNFPPVTPQDGHEIAMLASGYKSLKIDFYQPFYVKNSETNIAQNIEISDNERLLVGNNESSEYIHDLNETDNI